MQEKNKTAFAYVPASLFGSVMGLTGLAIAWELASNLYEVPFVISQIITFIAIFIFVVLVIAYALKMILEFESFSLEFKSPLSRSFFGTFIISILLLPIVIYHYVPIMAFVMWGIGVVLMLVFAWHMVSFWICSKQEIENVTPAWIIPVVGTLDIPLASNLFGQGGGFDYLNVLSLAIGLFFAVPIITLILLRVLISSKLPDKLMPTLMILIAPFSVGFSAYVSVNTEVDMFALGLFFLGVFVFLTLLPQTIASIRCCPFRVTWWAVSFPMSAMLVSMLKVAQAFDNVYFHALALAFLAFVSLGILWLLIRTIKGLLQGELKSF
ncbi:SLAC1 anion channel family protein [Helicobacter cappadocius]|uniref:SLAC1 anion channel family protein n=1 Tax=Helicobacter cappadocius TaxID=3063998 RepID=A0AA90PK18_9HELI|nr:MULTISPECIES: SLAC1 anion channel family protein [unclassified Helicobacter]MDO7252892.1 SLAC1 anion channel family protein [Helicobacter sp. faydin-H75]MDP2538935.1 SLAC1 anion channel family protein [Helicobacter sp. faydin-H76]